MARGGRARSECARYCLGVVLTGSGLRVGGTRLFVASVVSLFAAAAAALAAGGPGEKVRFNAADQAAARAVVIRRADLSAGVWAGGSKKPKLAPVICANYKPKSSDLVLTGAAESDWTGSGRIVGSDADILQTARMVRLDWQRSVTPAGVACTVTHAGATNVTVARVAFPRMAPYTSDFRASYGVNANGTVVREVFELAAVGTGRTEISVGEIMLAPAPLSALHADLVGLARIMLGRMSA
jgi:hypothetical protein